MIHTEPTPFKTDKEKTLKRICAWCAKIMGEGDGAISHGICPQCAERVLSDYQAFRGGCFRKTPWA